MYEIMLFKEAQSISESMQNTNWLPKLYTLLKHINLHVGEYKWSARSEDFSGWLMCDGRSLLRSSYPALFDVVGTHFGADDDDHFSLPDLRGRVFGGIGQGDALTARALGAAVGAETHVLTSGEMPSHTHTGTTQAGGDHNHGGFTDTAGSHTHTHNANGNTKGLAVVDGDNTTTTTDGTDPPPQNEINLAKTDALTINAAGDHQHTITSSGTHTHTFTTDATGGGAAHNNMQPTLFAGSIFIFAGLVEPFV